MISVDSLARGVSSTVAQIRGQRISVVFAMSIVNALLGLAMTALLARLLGVAGYGRYSFLLSILAMLAIPLAYGLRQTTLRETSYACARGTEYPNRLWFWACKTALMISLPVAIVVVAINAYNEYLAEEPSAIIWFLAALIVTPLVHVAVGALQGLGDVVRSQAPEYIVRPTTVLIFLISFAIFLPNVTLEATTALAFYATATLAAGSYGFYYLYRRRPVQAYDGSGGLTAAPAPGSGKLLKTVVGFSAISIIQVGNDNIDTLMLGLLDEPEAVGRYRVAVAVSTIVSLAIIAVNTVLAPRVARLWVSGERSELQRLVSFSTAITLSISTAAFLGLLLFGKFVIWILFGAEYIDALLPLLILSGGRCVVSGMGPMTTVLNQTGHERYMLAGLVLAVAVNVCLNLILIPLYSSVGASIAAATSLSTFAIFITISARIKTGINASPIFLKENPE